MKQWFCVEGFKDKMVCARTVIIAFIKLLNQFFGGGHRGGRSCDVLLLPKSYFILPDASLVPFVCFQMTQNVINSIDEIESGSMVSISSAAPLCFVYLTLYLNQNFVYYLYRTKKYKFSFWLDRRVECPPRTNPKKALRFKLYTINTVVFRFRDSIRGRQSQSRRNDRRCSQVGARTLLQ